MILFRKIIFLLLLIITFGGIFSLPSLIKVKKIECSSQFGPCTQRINEKLKTEEGKILKDVKKEIRAYLLADSEVDEFSLRFKLPSTVSVTVLEKKPRYALKAADEELYATVDNEGEVLAIANENSLPFVVISMRPPNLGEKVSAQILFALKIQERLFSSYQARSGELDGQTLRVNLPEGLTVLFPPEGDSDELLGALSLIIYELNRDDIDSRIGKETIHTIDLRFKNPVLK